MIQTDDGGERRFFHWRDSAAARSLMDLPQTAEILDALAGYEVVYLSAITLSLYGAEGRSRLRAAIDRARENGTRFAFDTNFRARGWPDLDLARAIFQQAFAVADIVLASTEDLLPLYPGMSSEALLARVPGAEVVLKLSGPASIVRLDGVPYPIKAKPVEAPSLIPRPPATVLRLPMLPRGWWARIRSRRRGPGIVWPALWYAIPERSSRVRTCRPV